MPAAAQGRYGDRGSRYDRSYDSAAQDLYRANSLKNARDVAQDRGNWIATARLDREIDRTEGYSSSRYSGTDRAIDAAAQDLYRLNSLKNARCHYEECHNDIAVARLDREISALQCEMDRLHDRIAR